jgi:hypothetical protein
LFRDEYFLGSQVSFLHVWMFNKLEGNKRERKSS